MDWNHDGVVNLADWTAYFDDWNCLYTTPPVGVKHIGNELWALDVNEDGWVNQVDRCAFREKLRHAGVNVPEITNIDCSGSPD